MSQAPSANNENGKGEEAIDERLLSQIARELHESWLKGRQAEGWKYGAQHNAEKKETPHFLPHEELPEAAREFNRRVTVDILNALAKSGYEVHRSEEEEAVPPTEGAKIYAATNLLKKRKWGRLEQHLKGLPDGLWFFSVELYRVVCEGLVELGEPSFAYETAAEGLVRFKGDPRLKQFQALAMAQSGAPRAALGILESLEKSWESDPAALPVFARVCKDVWRLAFDPDTKRKALEKSFEYYQKAFAAKPEFYTAINAATTALLLGKRETARKFAEIAQQGGREALRAEGDSFWTLATLGEAALVLENFTEAQDFYSRAGKLPKVGRGAMISARRQSRLLLSFLGRDVEELEDCFDLPRVVCFVGHMIDAPGRATPRFPESRVEEVKAAIKASLEKNNCKVGYASAACGSDILFAEALLELGGEVHVVLPFERESFRKISVDRGTLNWSARFDEVLSHATTVTYASHDEYAQSAVSFDYCGKFFLGLAIMKAKLQETQLRGLAVWDGRAGDGFGGTSTTIELWQQLGIPLEVIMVGESQKKIAAAAVGPKGAAAAGAKPKMSQGIRAMLFADVVGFSKLQEKEIPLFLEHYLAAVGKLLDHTVNQPEVQNTWGDGLYLVFDSVRQAGLFALELQAMVDGKKWLELGFLKTLKVRVGLHAGPVFFFEDGVIKKSNCMGSHLSRAARIEPITEEGQIYVSEPFAALAAVEAVREFVCEYKGEKMLAKKYGQNTLYLLRETGGVVPVSIP